MQIDPTTEAGAKLIAHAVTAYWKERGFIVRTWIDSFAINKTPYFCVRSDMVNGYPIRRVS